MNDYMILVPLLLLIADFIGSIGLYVAFRELQARKRHGKPEAHNFNINCVAQDPFWHKVNDSTRELRLTDGSTITFKEG